MFGRVCPQQNNKPTQNHRSLMRVLRCFGKCYKSMKKVQLSFSDKELECSDVNTVKR